MATLKNVAIIGGVIALGGAGYFQWRIQANFRQQPFYLESIRLLHGYPPALKLLGEPIKVKYLDLGDTEKTWTDGLNSRLAIPLKGPRSSATLHSWADRKSIKDQWSVNRLDLEIKNRCWTFYIKPNSETAQENKEDIQQSEQKEASDESSSGQLLYLNVPSK